MIYQCKAIDVSNLCTEWQEATPFLPPLSLAEGAELSAYIVGAWIIALCGRYLLHRLGVR